MAKECFKCGEEKPLSEFYKHAQMGDGYLNKCKECTKSDVRSNRRKRIDYYREYDKRRAMLPHRASAREEYNKSERGREVKKRVNRLYEMRWPKKRAAKITVGNAVRDGGLIRMPCEVCGSTKHIHAHHDDYNKPLTVRWLCRYHHVEWHRNNEPKY